MSLLDKWALPSAVRLVLVILGQRNVKVIIVLMIIRTETNSIVIPPDSIIKVTLLIITENIPSWFHLILFRLFHL